MAFGWQWCRGNDAKHQTGDAHCCKQERYVFERFRIVFACRHHQPAETSEEKVKVLFDRKRPGVTPQRIIIVLNE
jgi:hypothetical protein